ncbi:MAG: STAS domain-containing protein [Actinomycetota bacterium]
MSEIDLSLDETIVNGWTVIRVEGDLDLHTAPRLRDHIHRLAEADVKKLIVDLIAVDFMDSSGLGALVSGLKRLREREGTMSLVCTSGSVLKVLAITGLDRAFPIFDSVDEAAAG